MEITDRIANLSPDKKALLELMLKKVSTKSQEAWSIPPRLKDQLLPLSFAQQRLWFLDQLMPGSPLYNMAFALRLRGRLNTGCLEQSLNAVISRHEVLRTTIEVVDGNPTQMIANKHLLEIQVIDLRDWAGEAKASEAVRLATADRMRPFDLARDLMVRVLLLRLEEREYVLALTMHHIASDGWSKEILLQELSACYEAYLRGEEPALGALPVQYADFALWQRGWLHGEVLARQLAYWKKQLEGAPPMLELPIDRPRPTMPTFRGAMKSWVLDEPLTQKLKDLSRREGVTLFMTLLASFQVLLHRYTGQKDIVVGTPIAGRERAEIEGLIGFFVNTLVMRTNLTDDPTFSQVLKRVSEMALAAYRHQALPFEKLVDEMKVERELGRNPLFQVMFMFQNAPTRPLTFHGLEVCPFEVGTEMAKFDLTLSMAERPSGLIGQLYYSTDLFTEETIERMSHHYRRLLEGVADNPEAAISTLSIVTESERTQILYDWNPSSVNPFVQGCVFHLFEAQVQRTPNAVALVLENERLTYEELNQRSNQVAHYLRKVDVGRGTLVGICMERSLEMVVGLLGILKAGGAYVPLDPSYPKERLAFMLQDSQTSLMLTQQSLLESVSGHASRTICLDTQWEEISRESGQNPANCIDRGDLAYVIYTSGSTGRPKGTRIPHRALANCLTSMQREPGLTAEDRLLAVTTLSFDIAALELFLPLCVGARLILVSREIAADGVQLLAALEEFQVTAMQATPVTWQLLIEAGWQGRKDLKILCGGEALSRVLAGKLLEMGASVWNLYGPTETTIWSLVKRVDAIDDRVVPIGRPIANTQVYVLDQHQQLVPVGVPGELYIGGSGVALGYLNRPELTDQKFVNLPFNPEASSRFYRTGDLGRYRTDGTIEFLGRIDHQVKLRGFRIELGEIESALARHPEVGQAVVVAREDLPGDQRLVAYVVGHVGHSCGIADLRNFLSTNLPDYMLPSAYVFLDTLPLTPSGKVDRRALPAPDQSQATLHASYKAPSSPMEKVLTEIWSEILNAQQLGVDDDFFELGGHSLLAVQLVARIRRDLKVEVPVRKIFENRTVSKLALSIKAALKTEQQPELARIQRAPRTEALPLSFVQERLWFLDQLEPGNPSYNIFSGRRIRGPLNVPELERSINAIVARHEVLRTTFSSAEEIPTQIINPVLAIDFPKIDLSGLPQAEREGEVQRLATETARRPFVLSEGPLFRSTLLRLGSEEHVLLLTLHHIIADGWSMGILYRELYHYYEAFSSGRECSIPELSFQYADFAVWQRHWLQEGRLKSQLVFWQQQMANAPALLKMSTDRPRPLKQSFRGAKQPIHLPKSLTEDLKRLSNREGVTLFMTLLTAFKTLLCKYAQGEDILVGSPIAGRSQIETEGLIGFFVNMLVLRTDLSGNPSFRELLRRVREVTLDAYANSDLPFEKLVEELRPERTLSYNPLFQVMFVLQNVPRPDSEFCGLSFSRVRGHASLSIVDLSLVLTEQPEGLVGSLIYSTDLFDQATILRMAGQYEKLLKAFLTNPDERIGKGLANKYTTMKRKPIRLSKEDLIQSGYLSNETKSPLVIRPREENLNLIEWASHNKEFIVARLTRDGGILFRDFRLTSEMEFEQFIKAIAGGLLDYTYGSTPRSHVSGKIYTSTEYPSDQSIPLHNEMSYATQWPMKIWFFCLRCADQQGETPIADSRRVFERIAPKIREEFTRKGVMYIRNFGEGIDVPWEQVFQTSSRSEVENYCHAAGLEVEWRADGRLRTRQVCQAIATHPETGETVWFNQAHLFHASSLRTELRTSLLASFKEEDLPRHASFGDGSPIPVRMLDEIREAYRQETLVFPWQQGDVLMLDNMLTAHGRMPFTGPRRVLVGMAEPWGPASPGNA